MPELHLHSMWTTKSPLVTELLDLFKQSTYSPKQIRPIYKKALSCVLANLFQAKKFNAKVIYSRNTSKQSKINVPLIDFLSSIGYVTNNIAKASSHTDKASTMELTSETYNAKREQVIIMLNNDDPFIRLRTGGKNKKDLPLPNKPTVIKRLNAPIKLYNQVWLDNEVTHLDGTRVIPFGWRSFTNDLSHGGRFYWSHMTLKGDNERGKEYRKGFLINGEPTKELDYKTIHFNLLYNDAKTQLVGDAYETEGFNRDVIKLAMISFMNIGTREAFKQKITLSGNHKNKDRDGFIEGMPEGIKGKDLAAAIDKRHALIADRFHEKDLGVTLQYRDSEILAKGLTELLTRGIPVLPYHDSIRFPESQSELVYKVMKDAYKSVTGYDIEVTE